jgi:hypothetical protein
LGQHVICPICNRAIREYDFDGGDLHEALITRGDVSGHKYQHLIYSAFNCVVVHHSCHMQIAGHGGDEVFEKCARYLVEHEGFDLVHEWLIGMMDAFPIV